MKTAFIMCGALAHEVIAIIDRHGWDVDLVGVPAIDHMYPERIAPDVDKRFQELHERYDRIFVLFGDCGSRGALDQLLERYKIERIEGPHCYEMYAGQRFQELMDEEPGTFFLTDFLVRAFRGTVLKGLGLDRYPNLRDEYFRNYRRMVYLVQEEDPALLQKAHNIARDLGLPLEIRYTGYGSLEQRLVAKMKRWQGNGQLGKI
ncbi:MAG: DUF1638 domain-containing protein [Chloroflexota bacterium]|nr:MAG: DUF1638 domain-containing protein [Chloroflexota bacterium]